MTLPTSILLFSAAVIAVVVFVLWRLSFPRPFPGIPYFEESLRKPFGDIPGIIGAGEPSAFFLSRCHAIGSPIFQLFLNPFGRPVVFVADNREAHDILARRTKEFDRADLFSDIFIALAPNNQVCMPTNDQWHANRRLMADTMSPAFLKQSAQPQVQATFTSFIELWHARARLAKGRPFDAERDIDCAMLDAITGIAFGASTHATDAERDYVAGESATMQEDIQGGQTVVKFSQIPPPSEHTAIEKIAHSTEIAAKSAVGSWAHWFALKFYPDLRNAQKQRRKIIDRQVGIAVEKFSNPEAAGDDVRSAADLIISREIAMAKKQGRAPQVRSPFIDDELIGFVVAGYDTTATTIKWVVKFLSNNQVIQFKLRNELRAAYKEAAENNTLPTAEDIAKSRPVYLDAFIEEVLRLGNPGFMPLRTTTTDVVILGHVVPKKTDIVLMSVGPSHTEKPYNVDEKLRSKSCQDTIDSTYSGNWDPSTLNQFMPDRWLQQNEKGELEFNPRAGTQQTFGGGLRGCFGRKLAYLVLRIVVTYITWEFELQALESELSSMQNKVVLANTPVACYAKLRSLRK